MSGLRHDLRYAWRQCRRSPGASLAAGLTLALGIGGTVAMFAVTWAVLLGPLPFADEHRLFRLRMAIAGSDVLVGLPPHAFFAVQEQSTVLASAVGQRYQDVTLGGPDPQQLAMISVTPGWIATLGVLPQLGRGFSAEEARAGEPGDAVLVSHGLWQRRLGGRRDAIGETLEIDGRRRTVVGVMPAEFNYPYGSDLWAPATPDPAPGQSGNLNVAARLRPGASPEQLEAELATIGRRLAAELPDVYAGRSLVAIPVRRSLVGDRDRVVLALLAAVGFVLLVACGNVAALTLARAESRAPELALRAALGATRWRQVRQLLTEGMVLALVAGTAGVLLASLWSGALGTLLPSGVADLRPAVRIEVAAALVGLAVSTAAAFLVALPPALRVTRETARLPTGAGARATGPVRESRALRLIVAAEIAVVLTLLAGVAVMLEDFRRQLAADLGLEAEEVQTLKVAVPPLRYPDPAARVRLAERLAEAAGRVPGVNAAAITSNLPVVSQNMLAAVTPEGRVLADDERIVVNHRLVTPGYFAAMGIPLLRGRDLSAGDRPGTTPVVVVSQAMARRHWGAEDPVGRRVLEGRAGGDGAWRTIVGVVGDVVEPGESAETWYLPYAQGEVPSAAIPDPPSQVILAARAPRGTVAGTTLREAVRGVDPALPVFDVATMAERYATRLAPRRLAALICAGFGGLALLLGAVGIFGVVSHSVNRRTRELGVRLALGAEPGALARAILRREAAAIAGGGCLGLVGALSLGRVMRGYVVGTEPTHPLLLVSVVLLLAAVALTAALLPARRAARMDPCLTLRSE